MLDFFSSPFFGQINSLAADDASLAHVFKKVRGKISNYALSIDVLPEDLLVSHIADDRADLRKGFISFIEKLPVKDGAGTERDKKYRGEIYSQVRRLITAIFAVTKSGESEDCSSGNTLSGSFLEQQSPEWMNPLINILARKTETCYRVPKGVNRLKYPLTSNSAELLSVLLKVLQTSKCSSLESLLVDCRSEIPAEINRRHFGTDAKNLITNCSNMRRKLGFHVGRPALGSMPFEQWSPGFQKQWHMYEELAGTGVSRDSLLGKMAAHYKMSVGKSKPVTVDGYKKALAIGLFYCQPLPEDWGIENLLSLDERTMTIAGLEHSESYNSFVDRYRTREQNRESKVKRKGFNSAAFEQFTKGLTTVAGFNGFFNLVEPFRRAYRSNLDIESTRLNKDAKKKLFSIAAIDENIDRLELEFNRIVKDRSFERRAGVSKDEADKKMRLCLFLPLFTAIRFLGLRQKNIRNFRLMGDPENQNHPEGNVGFRKDGTLVVHFTKEETKNKKPLHHEFSHRLETHAPLIRILRTYYKKVYPYISKNVVSSLDEQFFAFMPKKFPGKFAFLPDESRRFNDIFVLWGNEFLIFRNMMAKNSLRLNPHHLRGICVDWLVKYLKWSLDKAAEYIADTPEMLKSEYLDRNRVHDATSILEDTNRELRAGQAEKEALEDARRVAEQGKIEAVKRAERENIAGKQWNRMEETLNRLDSANSALAAENALLRELLAKKAGADATAP